MRPEPPAEWTRAAVDAARTLKAQTRWDAKEWLKSTNGRKTTRSIYAILLHNPNHEDPFGVYVGHTHHRPFERYAEHRKGEGFADVQKFHVRLLPELYQHLNPMKPAEAKEMEKALCAALRSAGIGWVTMGSKRRASKEKKQ
ncbi:hypothetical protein AS026_10365 [Rhizobium altiplani]|uniref:GIY-YIG domain-containing protein n=1 Tax=Rhizobium altiplani TaxID=1864509 RepID=A0A109JIM5_9HYPH|nr:hypothetical protein AS026_10365 [Rhizobium altiplani]